MNRRNLSSRMRQISKRKTELLTKIERKMEIRRRMEIEKERMTTRMIMSSLSKSKLIRLKSRRNRCLTSLKQSSTRLHSSS